MTGPEHFKAGEKLLKESERTTSSDEDKRTMAILKAQQAQAHFMAAQVAATIRAAYASMSEDENALQLQDEWGM